MADIYAVCLSVSQGVDGPQATGHLSVKSGDREANLTIAWERTDPINAGGDPGAWLYAVLHRLVEHFDEHDVTAAEISGVEDMKEEVRG